MREIKDKPKVNGKEIICAILDNMNEGAFEIHYTTVVPAVYRIYLNHNDFEKIALLSGKIIEQAKQVLEEEIDGRNGSSANDGLLVWATNLFTEIKKGLKKILYGKSSEIINTWEKPAIGWQISINEDPNEEVPEGSIDVDSEWDVSPKNTFAVGKPTKRLLTRRSDGESLIVKSSNYTPTIEFQDIPSRESCSSEAIALLHFKNQDDVWQKFEIIKEFIKVGRKNSVDLTLDTSKSDISGEHLTIRHAEGKFYAKDISKFGLTWIDGMQMKNIETELFNNSIIRLGNSMEMRFQIVNKE